MATWKYYEQFGQTGGTSSLVYVDSYKGDDANPGTHLLPKQSMQAGFDVITVTGAVMVIAGHFKENGFLNVPSQNIIIVEGYCLLDVSGGNLSMNNYRINTLDYSMTQLWKFGLLHIKNVTNMNLSGFGANIRINNCFLDNCFNLSFQSGLAQIRNSIVKNGLTGNSFNSTSIVSNCCFFGEKVLSNLAICQFRNNYISPTTKVEFGNITAANFNYNHFEGTLTDKIRINNVYYDNIEAVKAALPTYAVNDLPSTTDPLFNGMSNEDFTPTENSPLLGAGQNGVNIGAFDISIGQAADSANWTLSNIDNTTNPDAAVLDAGGSGTLTANTGIQLFSDGKRRVISRILLPGSVIDPEFGETINSQLGTDAGIPSKYSIEIQYSTDGGSTYNGTWLKVPYGAMPLYDAANNVGNADPAFVSGGRISATHVLPRITLRNND
jgi:hypothetical protein